MTKRYFEIFLGSPDGLKGLIHSSIDELLSFYKDSLWYGLSEDVLNYVGSLDFKSELQPADLSEARYIDRFVEYSIDFYGEHNDFPESLGDIWCNDSDLDEAFLKCGRRIFSGFGKEFDTGKKSSKIGYITYSELEHLEITSSKELLDMFNLAKKVAIEQGCGIVYSID